MRSNIKKKLYIVGAGPGDPDLLTVKAFNILTKEAETIIHDRLISKEIIDLIPDHVEKIYAGKSSNIHCMTQDEINAEMVKHVNLGKTVIRLKGGDPMIFGRCGEEIEYLEKHGIEYEIVAGITSASAIAAKLAMSLTHRNIAHSVFYITGHKQQDKPINHNWENLANPEVTLVIYMGLANLDYIVKNLIEAGLAKNTAAIAVENATTKLEKLYKGTILEITESLKKLEFKAPVTIIIGKAASLAKI